MRIEWLEIGLEWFATIQVSKMTIHSDFFVNLKYIFENLAKDNSKMTNQEIEIVKRSWRSLQGISPVLLGDVFYSKLFIENPSLERMFKSSREVQAKKLIDMLDVVVRRLNNLSELSDEIQAMAKRHEGYGAKPKHYDQVGKALIWTLKSGLGNEWNSDVESAWSNCYKTLSKAMIEA